MRQSLTLICAERDRRLTGMSTILRVGSSAAAAVPSDKGKKFSVAIGLSMDQ